MPVLCQGAQVEHINCVTRTTILLDYLHIRLILITLVIIIFTLNFPFTLLCIATIPYQHDLCRLQHTPDIGFSQNFHQGSAFLFFLQVTEYLVEAVQAAGWAAAVW